MESAVKLDLFSKKRPKAVKIEGVEALQVKTVVRSESLKSESVSWEKNFQDMDSKLRAGGLYIHKVDADGSCLFRSFSHQLYGHEVEHANLRREAVAFILSNQQFFAPFMDEGVTIQAYCTLMMRPETWAGQHEIQALSLLKGVNVYVYQSEGSVEMLNHSDESGLVVVSYHDGNHYNSVAPTSESSRAPSEQMTITELKRRLAPPPPLPPPPVVAVKKKGFFN